MIDPIEEKQIPLPEPKVTSADFTYQFPHVLLGAGVDANGFRAVQIREGKVKQVKHTTEISYSDVPVEEKPFVFHSYNVLRFGGQELQIINDAVDLPKLKLPATSPSAAEYLGLIGNPVMMAFACVRDLKLSDERGVPTYRIARTTVILQ